MFANTSCLIKACIELNISYKLLAKTNFVSIIKKFDNLDNLNKTFNTTQKKVKKGKILAQSEFNKIFYFINNAVPINSHIDALIAQDKDFTYEVLNSSIKMPKTSSYMDPNCQNKYKEYLKYHSLKEILEDITKKFNLPVIIKRNSGSIGNNVFLCKNVEEIKSCIETIFNQQSKDYDYILLAQEYIPILKEFRVIVLNRLVELVYIKDNSNAFFNGNLSPLHYDGAKTIKIKEPLLINRIQKFITPLFEKIDIAYFGADIAIDEMDNLSLIEINSKPGVEHYVANNGEKDIIDIYKKILLNLN